MYPARTIGQNTSGGEPPFLREFAKAQLLALEQSVREARATVEAYRG